MEQISKSVISNKGQDYVEYHAEFKKKSLCLKLWLIFKNLGTHLYYSYFASEEERYMYKALRHYLDCKQQMKASNK